MAKQQTQIVRLSLVGRNGRSPVFIGWDKNDTPSASEYASDEVIEDFKAAKESGASFPNVGPEITCFEFSSLGKGIDYPGSKEDVIPVNAKDKDGRSVILNLGEISLLKALSWSLDEEKNVWNSISGSNLVEDSSGVRSTVPIYTLLFQDNRVQNGGMCALLFKPLVFSSNEDTFIRFSKGVIKQLLIIDESQPPDARKGYIRVAAQASKGGLKKGLADLIFDTADQETAKALGNAKASGLKLLQTLGIAEISDELIKEIKDPLPNYNIQNLDNKSLLELANAMEELAPYRNRS